ncbi:hypothetical protein MAPG_01856 [Magnaporthiopsis poae ATCC 64411]|uniref:Ubiquitin interaction domain-containing protein n=1 Tax=Magnaporthiopsis poae (strain ATCC 64411 / 73-15) TaxID=644358 RepID=A0A0C4DPT4_MAGP6|nr:hypothetical protein MAPG_01856 [Magnaporthiopsis poae ATCC 64411]
MSEEDLVDQVCDFTGLRKAVDRDLILSALRAKNNNTEAVVAEFYEDEGKFREQYTWTELPFLADRDGTLPDAPNIPTFSIQGADDGGVIHGVPPSGSVPPSRPPSRTDNRSPLGRVVDWTVNGTAGAPNSRAQEEADLQRALAESAAHSGLQVPPQESGVMGSQGDDVHLPSFGPAVRDHYDQSKWAVVPIIRERPDPRPSDRKRDPGVPAFLRCRKDGTDQQRLGALITIYHEIPAIRNFLLETGPPATTYGINNLWWKGEPILPKTQEEPPVQQEEDAMEWQTTPEPDFCEELHRLMAFLDLTERSYGTADVLASLQLIRAEWGAEVPESKFFDLLREYHSRDSLTRLFWEVGIFSFSSSGPATDDSPERFAILDMRLNAAQYQKIETLYDAWDELFWIDVNSTSEDESSLRTAAITEIADVLTMTFGGEGGLVRPLDIPETFYIDRYLAERRDESMEQQLEIRSLRRRLAEIDRLEFDMSRWWSQKDQQWKEKIAMSRAVIEDRVAREEDLRFTALRRRWFESVDTPEYFHFIPGYMDGKIQFTKTELALLEQWKRDKEDHEGIIETITKKKEDYSKLRANIETEIRARTQKNSIPCPEEGWRPTHRYNLRGVATANDIYVARRAEPDLIDMDNESRPSDQWWRFSYVATDEENPLKVSISTVEEARQAVSTEGKVPYLVYANDAAMDAAPIPLSAALRTFVKFDNRYFKQELIEQTPEDNRPPRASKPALPARSLAQELHQMVQEPGRQEQQQPLVSFDEPPLTESQPLGGVRTTSTEVFPSNNSNGTSLGYVDQGTEMTDMTEIHLVDTNLTPSSSTNTTSIHTPSTQRSEAAKEPVDRPRMPPVDGVK